MVFFIILHLPIHYSLPKHKLISFTLSIRNNLLVNFLKPKFLFLNYKISYLE